MSVWLNILVICAVIILVPMALATLLLTASLIWTAVGDVRRSSRAAARQIHLYDLLREKP